MSGRRRRSETFWDGTEERRNSADIHSNVSPGRSQYWSKSEVHNDLMHGNFSRSPSRDPLQGNRNGHKDGDIRRDRNRMYTHSTPDGWEKQYGTHPSDDSYGQPYRSRDKGVGGNVRMSREQERERTRSPNRSRSRSRDRVSRSSRETTRGLRHESNATYPNMRNSSNDYSSRGGGNNTTESWNRRTDYNGSSRYNDYRNTRIPCKYFVAGNCNREDNCKFSHDVPEAAAGGFDDSRNSGNKTRTWNNDLQPHDDLNTKSSRGEMGKRSWNSSLWEDVESGGFSGSRQSHTSDVNNNKNSYNARDNRDDKESLDEHASRGASGFHDVEKSHRNLDNKKSSWNAPTWDDVSGSGFSRVLNPCHKYEESAEESLNNNNNNNNNTRGRMSAKSGSDIDTHKRKKWDGPLWSEFSEPVVVHTDDSKTRKWDGPGFSKIASDHAQIVVDDLSLNNMVSEDANQQIYTSGKDLIQSVHDMSTTQSLSYSNGSEQNHMLLSNRFNGPLDGQGQEGMYEQMEDQNKGGKPLKPSEMHVPQPQAMNAVNETSLTSQLHLQANTLPAAISHKAQFSQLFTESNITNAIDYLKSLPSSAYSQDTRANEEQNSVSNMEVNVSVPMGILSGSVTQQNQTPADPTHDSGKLSGIGVVNKEADDKRVAENHKKEGENTNPDKNEAQGKTEEGDSGNDDKAMRQFKAGLVEFVKEILKPKWKEGKMSRDVHKTVVKKVVEKVTSTIQGSQIPRTQPKIDQYLAYSKPKITKLVEAYMERLVKS